MKQLLTLLGLLLAFTSFSQKSDTLTIDISKYKFIKILNKVYKIDASITMVPKKEGLLLSIDTALYFPKQVWGGFTTPASQGYGDPLIIKDSIGIPWNGHITTTGTLYTDSSILVSRKVLH